MNKQDHLTEVFENSRRCFRCDTAKVFKENERIRDWFLRGPWAFPPYRGVRGYYGTGDVVIVCSNPSTGAFPTKKDKMFYAVLSEMGFRDAHLTDTIKRRGIAGSETEKQFDKCFTHFKWEVEIIKPRVIVAVGDKAFNYLKYKLRNDRMHVEKITHYAFRWKNPNSVKKRMKEELKRIKRVYGIRSSER